MHNPPIVEGIKYFGMTMRKRSILQLNTWFKYDDPLFLELSIVQTFSIQMLKGPPKLNFMVALWQAVCNKIRCHSDVDVRLPHIDVRLSDINVEG